MLSSLSPSTPIRNYHFNQKGSAPSPRSVQSATHPSPINSKEDNQTMNKTVEGQVSFRTAARRFSSHATVVVPPSPLSAKQPVKQRISSSIPLAPNTTGSTRLKCKVGLNNLSTMPPLQQPKTLPTMEPLDIDDSKAVTSTGTIKNAVITRVQRDEPYRFPTTNRSENESSTGTQGRQQRRSSTGYYDPRMAPSFVASPFTTKESVKVAITSPIRLYTNDINIDTKMKQLRRSSINNGEIDIVPVVSPMATTKIYTPLSSPTKGNQNEYLTNNKVFQKRYNFAATTIQRVYRGRMHRSRLVRIVSAVRIQTVVRKYMHERIVQKYNASTLLQKLFRGFATRLRSKVYQLEHQLHQIQQCHARELHAIQQKKEEELQSINELIGQEHVKYMKEKSQRQNTIDEANRIIKYLRKENKKVRDKNEALRVAIDQLIEENDMMERQAREYKEFTANLDQMKVLDNENNTLTFIIEQFEQRKTQFDDAIEKRDEFIMHENKMGRLYLQQIQQMVTLIEETCIDPYLVTYIEDLCIKCNLPGTGLEAAVADETMDCSERTFKN